MLMRIAPLFLILSAGCSDVEGDGHDHDHGHNHDHEVITTVSLTFSPETGDDLVFTWADPEDDGSPTIDDIVLPAGTYTVDVAFLNELENPAEDITEEISDEADQHQVFFTGASIEGPATGENPDAVVTHAYADTDPNGLPVGLKNTFTTIEAGAAPLTVTLRHMPPEDGKDVKVSGLAEDVASGGFSSIGGANDVQVEFSLTVQ